MKKPILLMISLLLPVVAYAEQVKLDDGTRVRLRLMDNISSSRNHAGDPVSLQVMDDVVWSDNKTVLIKAGTAASGKVSQSEERGRMGKKGQIGINLESTKAVDGTRVYLRGNNTSAGKDKVGSTVALSLIISPLFLLKRGTDASMTSGETITGTVDRDYMVNISDIAHVPEPPKDSLKTLIDNLDAKE